MPNTIPAESIEQEEIGYALLAFLSDAARNAVTDLLKALDAELPHMLWCMPPAALHITLCEIIQPKIYEQDKDVLYSEHQREYINLPGTILANFKKVRVTFNTIEASPNAIIIRGSDEGDFEAIRTQLVEQLPIPAQTKRPPDIIHSSIARYIAQVDLAKVQAALKHHHIAFEEEIQEFKLVRSTTQPLLNYEIIKTYPLAA